MRQETGKTAITVEEISIHASHAGCDAKMGRNCKARYRFQSTHPMRDATDAPDCITGVYEFQSTHTMRDATDAEKIVAEFMEFQSTHPMRDATMLID